MIPQLDIAEADKPKRGPFGCILSLAKWVLIIVAVGTMMMLLL